MLTVLRAVRCKLRWRASVAVSLLYCLVWLSLWLLGQYRLQSEIHWALQDRLPVTIEQAMVNAHNEQLMLDHIRQQLSAGLELSFGLQEILSLVKSARFKELDVRYVGADTASKLHWQYADKTLAVGYAVEIQANVLSISLYTLLITALSICVYRLLPQRQSAEIKRWQRRFREAGLSLEQQQLLIQSLTKQPKLAQIARELVENSSLDYVQAFAIACDDDFNRLNDTQRAWFTLALTRLNSVPEAIAVAKSPQILEIDLVNSRVSIHGLVIALAKTPLFYYFWYAQRQSQNLGLYLNPPQSKPDQVQGQLLAEIMQAHDGHRRAINDLREYGLKSKTLDQNRNKIKDELHSVLGDLADPYLFTSQRDGRSARYGYGLRLPAENIRLHTC